MEITNKSLEDIKNIEKYLETLDEFNEFLKPKSENISDLINKVANNLKYEKIENKRVIVKFGEKGTKFYLILRGKCSIFLPKFEKIKMNQNEFFNYLIRLKKFKEKDILSKVIPLNRNTFPLENIEIAWLKGEARTIPLSKNKTPFEKYFKLYTFLEENYDNFTSDEINWKLFEEEKYQFSSIRYQQICTGEEYMKNVNPIHNTEHSGKDCKEVSVYTYIHHLDLKTGNKFGDLALVSISQKRNATIISNEQMHFGIFEKRDFMRIINDVNDKVKKMEIKIIQQQSVFSCININVFQRNYFKYFTHKKIKRGNIIASEGCDADSIFIVKEGLFEITVKKNNFEFVDFINILGERMQQTINEEELKYENEEFNNFMKNKKTYKIEKIENNDIIGLEDMTINNKHIFSIELQSIEGEVYEIKKDFFEKMMKSNSTMKKNYKEFCKIKRQHWIDRLKTIYNSKINFYKKFKIKKGDRKEIQESDEQNYVEEPKIENDEIFKEKVNMNSTQMNFESKHLKEIDQKGKMKIKKSEPKKKRVYEEEETEGQKLYKLAIYRIHEEKRVKFLEGLKEKKELREREMKNYMKYIKNSVDKDKKIDEINEKKINEEDRQKFSGKYLDTSNLDVTKNFNLDLLQSSVKVNKNNKEFFKTEIPKEINLDEQKFHKEFDSWNVNLLPHEKLNNDTSYLKKEILNNLLYTQNNKTDELANTNNNSNKITSPNNLLSSLKDFTFNNITSSEKNHKFHNYINNLELEEFDINTNTKSKNDLANANKDFLDQTGKQILSHTLVNFLSNDKNKKSKKEIKEQNNYSKDPINIGMSVTKINFTNFTNKNSNTDKETYFNYLENNKNQKSKQIKTKENIEKILISDTKADKFYNIHPITETKDNFNFNDVDDLNLISESNFNNQNFNSKNTYSDFNALESKISFHSKIKSKFNGNSFNNYEGKNTINVINIKNKNLNFENNFNEEKKSLSKIRTKIYNKEGKVINIAGKKNQKSYQNNKDAKSSKNLEEINIKNYGSCCSTLKSADTNSFVSENSHSHKTIKMKNAIDLMERDSRINDYKDNRDIVKNSKEFVNKYQSSDETIEKIVSKKNKNKESMINTFHNFEFNKLNLINNKEKKLDESLEFKETPQKNYKNNCVDDNRVYFKTNKDSNLRLFHEGLNSDEKIEKSSKKEKFDLEVKSPNIETKKKSNLSKKSNIVIKNDNENENENIIEKETAENTYTINIRKNSSEEKKVKIENKRIIPEIKIDTNNNHININEEIKINNKENFEKKKKLFLIDELNKVMQSTRYNEFANKDLNKLIYEKVFSKMMIEENPGKSNENKENQFIDYLAVDKFNQIYSTSFRRTMGFFDYENKKVIKMPKLKNLEDPFNQHKENYLDKIKTSSCMTTGNLQNMISRNIVQEPKTKFSTFYSNSTYGSFNYATNYPQIRSNSTSLYLMNDKARNIYKPKKFMRYMPSNKKI